MTPSRKTILHIIETNMAQSRDFTVHIGFFTILEQQLQTRRNRHHFITNISSAIITKGTDQHGLGR